MTFLQKAIALLAPPHRIPLSYGGAFLSQLAETPHSVLSQLEAMTASGWIFACVDRIATAIASTNWRLFRVAANGERKEALDHPLLDLWRSVNPFDTSEGFLEISQQHMELTGETWWVLLRDGVGHLVELWPIRPDRMRPVPNREKYIAGYLYVIGNEVIPLRLEDVIFIRRPHPVNTYRGLGVIESIFADMESERNAAKYVAAFYRNNAEPGGVIEFDESLADADFERLVSRWKAQHQGVANAHRVAIIERGHWKDRLYTQRDMQFAELRKVNRDTIIGAFGIPLSVLGITENVNRANAEAGEVTFSRWVLLPRLRRIRGAVNERLCPQFGPDLEFDFEDPTPIDRELNLNEAERGYRAGFLTKNEARKRVGEGDVEGGEEFGATPLGIPLGGLRMLKAADPNATDLYATPLQKAERKMARAWALRLEAEVDALVEYLGQFKSYQKLEPSDAAGYPWEWWAKYGAEVVGELSAAFSAQLVFELPNASVPEVQRLAGVFAEARGARLLKLEGPENLVSLTRERVNTLVSESLVRGDSLGTLTKNLRADLAFSKERASRIARTETATALGQGSKQSAVMQGRDEKGWVTQGDELVSQEICAPNEAAGWIGLGDSFPSGHDTIPGHPNCLLPGNRVIAPQTIAASRALYHGEAVELTTENGDKLAVTPNHMILTSSGFVKAEFLRKGDYIISSLDAQRIASWLNPDDDYRPTSIEEIWDSLMMEQGMLSCFVPTSPKDFHGDARGFEGKIDIISTDGFLGDGFYPLFPQHFGKKTLPFRDAQSFELPGSGSFFSGGQRWFPSPNSSMGSLGQSRPFLGRQSAHSQGRGLATVPRGNTGANEMPSENRAAYLELARQFLFRFANLITEQKLVEIRKFNFSGHVFDLQTLEGLYICNNYLVKNCRCNVRFRTKALHEEGIKPNRHKTCGKLLVASKSLGKMWCRYCKVEV